MILRSQTGYLHSLTGLMVGIGTYTRDGPSLRQNTVIRPDRCPHGKRSIPNPECVCGIYYFDSTLALRNYWAQTAHIFRADLMAETAVTKGIATGPHLPDFLYPDQPGARRAAQYTIESIAVQKWTPKPTVRLLEDHYRVPVTLGITEALT